MVEIQNLTASYVDVSFVRRVVRETLQSSGMYGIIGVGVVFVGTARMRRLNTTYHHENRVTDVLSFPASPTFFIPKFYGESYLGEIVVCAPYLKKQALDTRAPYRTMLAHVLIHGTLHLMGYEHDVGGANSTRMHHREEKIMKKLGIEFGQ